MSALKPYPHYEINVKDNSIYTFAVEEVLPVHRPLYTLVCQEGPVGDPVWCPNATALRKKFGEQTLNLANPKFASMQSFYLNQILSYNGAFVVRALPEDAKVATAILVAEVDEDADIVQYEIDQDITSDNYGKRLVDLDPDSDTYGKYIPLMSGGQPVTEKGIYITFKVRPPTPLEVENGLNDLKPTGNQYPILALTALNPGEYGNDLAFRFFCKKSENSPASVALYKTIFNSLIVARREYNSTTTNIVRDIFGRDYNTFAADPECADPETGVKMGMESVITTAFDVDSAEGSDFPFTVYTYEENLKAIGDKIIAAEVASTDGGSSLALEALGYTSYKQMNGYQINVLGGTNINGEPYNHVAISGRFDVDPVVTYTYTQTEDTAYLENKTYFKEAEIPGSSSKKYSKMIAGVDYNVTDPITEEVAPTIFERTETDNSALYDEQTERVILDKDIDIFLTNGSDGAIATATEKERDDFTDHFMFRFLKLYVNPKIVDKFRYPFTHIYDLGYSMTTKYAMLDFLDTRDDVAVELSTQVLFPSKWATGFERDITLNDQAKDLQDGMVLRERALLMRESVLNGTDCMRASIYTQAGKPVAATWTKPVPFNFWSAIQHAKYGNTDQMSVQEPRGLPYSYNELFKTWKWINYSEPLKEKTWNAGLNYCQYADMTRIFYPALRTVYRAETSVLTDQWVVDALVYTKHECRKAWARFSGRNDKQAVLEAAIKNYLEERLAYLYNNKYDFTVEVYKTEEEQKLGYVEHVKLKLVFPATMRVINFDIEVNREGYNAVESEA